MADMRCWGCDQSEWHKMPGAHSQSMIQVCKKCGALCHDVDPSQESKWREFYRKDYKPTLNIAAIITASNKLQYIRKFLAEFLDGKKGLVCADVGAATGYVLNYLRGLGHKVTGAEWTLANRRFSEHFYGIPLTQELSDKRKYDFILMYHTLEHMVEPDKKLLKYTGMLTDGGRLMISTPMWLQNLEEQSGTQIMGGPERSTPQGSFDQLYHKNHINLFSKQALQNLFRKSGLTIVKDDLDCYGQTYLLRKGDIKPIEPEDWQEVSGILSSQRKALEAIFSQKYQDAVKAYPMFPEAWIALVFGVYGKDPERQADMLNDVPPKIRGGWRFLNAEAQWLARLERLDEALALLDRAMALRFQNESLFLSGEILTRMGKLPEANNRFAQVAAIHPHRWSEAYQWIVRNSVQQETWDEKGERAMRDIVFKKAVEGGAISLNEPEPVALPEAK